MRWSHLHLWNSKRQPPRSKAADMTRLQLKNASMPEVGDGGEANQSAWFEDRWRFSTGGWSLFVPCGSDWPPDRLKPTSLATDSHDTLIIVVVFTFHYWRSSKYDGRISNRAYDIPPFLGEYITSDCVPRSGISIFMGDLPVGVSSLPASIHRIPLPVEAMFVSSYLSFLLPKGGSWCGWFLVILDHVCSIKGRPWTDCWTLLDMRSLGWQVRLSEKEALVFKSHFRCWTSPKSCANHQCGCVWK